MATPEDVLRFWLDEVGQNKERWFRSDPELDAEIRERFQSTWTAAMDGALSLWLTYPSGSLAYIILTDQFPRNMFRDTPEAFASDALARAAAKSAIAKDWDLRIDEPARQFFFMPLMHSECLPDQDRCIRLLMTRMPETGDRNILHARVHREIIRKFGRFPYRNEALSRDTNATEAAFMADGGYGATLRELEAESAE
ncbi:MAG: DUF924 family protein [Pseudomonadota bacterium]